MNAPEKGKRYLLRPDDTAIIRTGSHAAFKKIAAEILANRPKPKKGASIVRELRALRLRGGRI